MLHELVWELSLPAQVPASDLIVVGHVGEPCHQHLKHIANPMKTLAEKEITNRHRELTRKQLVPVDFFYSDIRALTANSWLL